MPVPSNTPDKGFHMNEESPSTMSNSSLETAILFISYNEIEKSNRSFKQIKQAKPQQLYIACIIDDEAKAKERCDYLINSIDWDCDFKTSLHTNSNDTCIKTATAIDWFFDNEIAGIIIEDNVVASDSFFTYTSELLKRYIDDTKIMSISGSNYQDGIQRGKYSYYYSQVQHFCGWGSWRRAWKEYRKTEKIISHIITEIQSGTCPSLTHNKAANIMWQHELLKAYNSNNNSWEYIWTLAVLINSGLSCIPNVNLTEFICSADNAINFKQATSKKLFNKEEILLPLVHPDFIVYDKEADNYTYTNAFAIDEYINKSNAQEVSNAPKECTQPSIFQNNGGVKVLIISSKDTGGAGGAARRMHEAILNQGADSVMLVLDKQSTAPYVAQIEQPISNLDRSKQSAQLFYAFNIIQTKLANYPKRNNMEMFTTTESIVNYNELAQYIQQADVINVHWIDGFFDYYNAPAAFNGKHIVWTLHDMYQFTGGCHHAFECSNYITGCKGCPQMGEPDNCELTANAFNIKMHSYQNLNISVTAPSEWLKECAEQSMLMRGMDVEVVPNIFDINQFKPIDQDDARTKLNLPLNKTIILFGSDTVMRPVKNIKALITGLNELCRDNIIDPSSITLVIFGAGTVGNIKTPYDIVELGTLNSTEVMSNVYSSADFTAVPSLIESFSYLKCESLACGTPIVGFAVGGMPYLMENGVTGYLAKPYELEDFKNGILWGINTAKDNIGIRNKCREVIEVNLNEERVAGMMIDFYKATARKHTAPTTQARASIASNDPLRQRYIDALLSSQEHSIIQTASSFTTELSAWLNATMLPHRNLTQEEAKLKAACLSQLTLSNTTEGEYTKALLLAVVLIPAEELPLVINVYKQDNSLKDLLTQYIFCFKELPTNENFTESTLKHMCKYLLMLKLENKRNPQNASKLIMSAFNTLRKIPIYCADGGLREIMELTGDMMRDLLLLNNAAVDHTFPERDKTKKIKLGILLQAMSEHTETYATLPAFTNLDKNKYEIFVYVLKILHSSQEIQYKDHYDHLLEVSATQIPQSVSTIRQADLDIMLISTNITALANHNALISTHRLARVQAVHFCNPCTTGIKNVDYFITGNNFDLNSEDFTEKLIHNKHSGICFEGNTAVKAASLTLQRSNLGVPDDALVFITGANFYKFTWKLREFWAKLLAKIPSSYLLTLPFGPAWTNKYPVNEFNQSIHEQFTQHGVDENRLIILKPLPTREDVRQAVGLCDIYLDSFPYSGATSLLDPMHTNVPMVCMKTNSIRGGQGSGMLDDIGLTELIANNEDEYIEITLKLANDPEYRHSVSNLIKSKMRDNPVFLATNDYCHDMDRIYTTMLESYDARLSAVSNNNNTNNDASLTQQPRLKPNDICNCGSGLKYKKCCGK